MIREKTSVARYEKSGPKEVKLQRRSRSVRVEGTIPYRLRSLTRASAATRINCPETLS